MKNKKLLACVAFLAAFVPAFSGCAQTFEDVLIGVLTGFEKAPEPTIKEGRFNFSVTYELGGEVKTMSSVYVCKHAESGMTWSGWYISWDAYVEDGEIEALFQAESYYGGILLETNQDGKIYLDLSLNPEYFMAEPGWEDKGPCEPYFFILYHDDVAEQKGVYGADDAATLESYGAKIISYEYDSPIENTYK